MANRKVGLEVVIQDKSILALEQNLKEINAELKTLDVNSDAFLELSEKAKAADTELKDIKEDLKGISSEKQLDSVAKIGGALAASFSVATVAAQAFGAETEEEIQKAIQVATQLNVVVSSIKPIMEALSSTNRKAFAQYVSGLGDVIKGFKSSATYATLFGTTARAALTATGIGALIAALGTLIVYWDDITAHIGFADKAQQDFFDTQQTNIEKSKALLDGYIDSLEAQNQLLRIQGENESKIFDNRRAAATANLSIAQQEQKLAADRIAAFLQENNLTAENLKLRQSIQSTTGIEDPFIARLAELKKSYDEISKSVVNLKNQLSLLSAEENKFNEDQEKKAKDKQDRFAKEAAAFVYAKDQEVAKQIESEEAMMEAEAKRVTQEQMAAQEAAKLQEEERQRVQEMLELWIKMGLAVQQVNVDQETGLQKFQETMEELTPYIETVLQGFNSISQAMVDGLNTQIENLSTQIESVDMQYQQSIELRKSYEAELAYAQGEARDQLLESIDEERKKEQQLAKEQRKLQNEKIKAQNKANQVEYTNSIVNNVIATALAVTKALPNVPLSVVVGILGAIQTGIIVANKPEPIPLMAKGGFTEAVGGVDSTGYRVAGVVHENEYVVPERVLRTNRGSELVEVLEAMRTGKPGFASGGFTEESAPNIQPDISMANRLTAETIATAIGGLQIYASWTEGRDVGNNVTFLESRAAA